jgi:hypothetical protein
MDSLAPFDDEVIEQTAADVGLDAATLRDRLVDHYGHAATTPGIDELVMEWRRFLPYEPLVERTGDAYVLAVESSIWTEFGQQLSLSDTELRAIKTVHDAQARRVVDGTNFDGYDAMVLWR